MAEAYIRHRKAAGLTLNLLHGRARSDGMGAGGVQESCWVGGWGQHTATDLRGGLRRMVRATVRRTATGFQLDLGSAATEDPGLRDGSEVFVIRGDDEVVEIVPVESARGKVVAAYERIEEKSRAEARRLAGR